MNTDFVVLAAGEGKRMLGADPKVLLPVAGKPMAQHALDTISEIECYGTTQPKGQKRE